MPTDTAAQIGECVLVAETGLGRLQAVARTSTGSFVVDEPVSAGGLGSGPNPYVLLSAALGSCTVMTLRLYADLKAIPLRRSQACVTHHRSPADARDVFERVIDLEGPLDPAQRTRLLEIANRCPVHRTLERGSEIRTTLSAEPSAGD
jgi:putative redox protein